MTPSRYLRSSFALLLLALIGAGLYLYQNMPTVLGYLAKQTLQDFGVENIALERAQFDHRQFNVDRLWLRGHHEGYAFEATLTSLGVSYDWRVLINRRLKSVTLSSLELSIEQSDVSPASAPAAFNVENFLPQKLIAQLPVDELYLRHWQIDYRSQYAPPLFAKGSMQIAGQLDLQLETALAGSTITAALQTTERPPLATVKILQRDGKTQMTSLSAQLQSGEEDSWLWKVHGEGRYAPLLSWLRRLDAPAVRQQDTTILEQLELIGSWELTADVRHPNTLSLSLASDGSALQSVEATIQLVNTVEQFDYPGTIDRLAGTLTTGATLQRGKLQVALKPFQWTGNLYSEQLFIPREARQWLRWQETVPVRWNNPETLEIAYADGRWSGQLHGTLLELGDTQSQLTLEGLNLEGSVEIGEPLLLDLDLNSSIKTRLRKKQLPQFELALRQQGSIEQSAFTIALRDTAESIQVKLDGSMNMATGAGQYHLNAQSLDLPFFASTAAPLLLSFGLLPSSMQMHSGRIELDTTLNSADFDPATWEQESKLTLDELSGSYDEYRFDKLTLGAYWTGTEHWKTVTPAELSVEKLDLGFEVTNVVARVSLPRATPIASPVIEIENFSADIFGGLLFLPAPARWDFGGSSNTFTLRALAWQLADMVALQQGEDIQAQGTLEGELPVTVTDGRVIIEKGYLKALPPGGSIRYVASRALAETSKELELALDLLDNFQYQVLSTAVELDKEGKLILDLSLEGHNPSRFEGQAVNFNINLEQNLDPLLQSLRLSDKLQKKIENRLQ